MDIMRQIQDTQETLSKLEAIHGVLKAEIEEDLQALDRVLEGKGATASEFNDEWVRGCRTGMAIALDVLTARIQGVEISEDFPDRPIRIKYFEGLDGRHVEDESVIYREGEVYDGARETQ